MPNRKRVVKEKKSKKTKSKSTVAPHRGEKRSLWRGYISFGLVNIPVLLYSAEKPQQEVRFKLLDKKNQAGIRYSRINEETGKEVPWHDIVKGYEYEPGNYAILTSEDLNEIAKENLKSIDIEDFIDFDQLETIYFEKPYYLLPDKRGDKGYVLLRETLKKTKKVGIARVMVRSHQYLAAVIPQGNALVVNTLRYPEEVKTPSEIDAPDEPVNQYKITKKEFDIAAQLVETMSVEWDPSRYSNGYREDLLKLIDEKIASGGKKAIKHVETSHVKQTNVVDFMELLKKSVKEKKTTKLGGTKKDKANPSSKSKKH
jgi:DNA end-binding protein Ku